MYLWHSCDLCYFNNLCSFEANLIMNFNVICFMFSIKIFMSCDMFVYQLENFFSIIYDEILMGIIYVMNLYKCELHLKN